MGAEWMDGHGVWLAGGLRSGGWEGRASGGLGRNVSMEDT
jgi:hypothetical protein